MRRGSLPLFLALVLALLASYYWRPGGNPMADADVVKRQMALAQTYLEEPRSWSYNEAGVLTEVLEAQRAEYFARRDVSELEQPRLYSHDGNDRTWSAQAEWGRLKHRPNTLTLRRQVLLNNDQTGAELATRIMTIDMNRRTATARVPVTVTEGDNRIRAEGMVAYLDEERVEMGPNVESTYVPSRP